MSHTMLRRVPSVDALLVLSELCRGTHMHSRRYCSISIPTYNRISAPIHRTVGSIRSSPSLSTARRKTTLVDAPEPQTFANDPSKYDAQNRTGPEPGAQGTADPQLDASNAVLPDISNYYTLFPRTLPGGPPRPQSSIPDSSTIVNETPPVPHFYLNPRELRKEFLQLQSVYHPDKFASGSAAHQRAYALSTLLNNAFKTLADPLLRAQYLLQMLYDIDVTNEDNSAHPTDPETLMIVMEAQEELENATGKGGEDVVEKLKEENHNRIRESEKELGDAFENGDVDRAKDETVRLKYWRSLDGGLRDWEPGKEVRLTH